MTALPFRRITKGHRLRHCVLGFALVAAAPFLSASSAHATLSNDENAIDALGQFAADTTTPYYTKGCVDNGASKIGFSTPVGIAIDTVNHRLFVSESSNNRVLVFTLNGSNQISSKTPANVLGQADFVSCAANNLTGQSEMHGPVGLAFDATNNRLFVADALNNRVLVFDTSSITDGMNASHVLGEPDYTSYAGGTTQSLVNVPADVKYDSANNRLFVSEYTNNRVMVFNVAPGSIADGENASFELGQPSGGTAFTTNAAATTQSGMRNPLGLAYDPANTRLYVGDSENNRVLVFNVATGTIANGENASNELGQASGGTAFTSSAAVSTQSGLNGAAYLAFDSTNNRLFVGDDANNRGNNRVLVFNTSSITDGMNAAHVLGQSNFTNNNGVATQSGMSGPEGLAFDSANNLLYVAEGNNNRVSLFNVATGSIADGENASDLLGQYTSVSSTATVTYTQNAANNAMIQIGFYQPADIAMDALHHRLFVGDAYNNRVLVYNLNTDNSLPDRAPDNVLGQADFVSTGAATTQSGMNQPNGLAYDAVHDRLFVADTLNNRILVFDTSSISTGMNATNELGQPSGTAFTSNGNNATQWGFDIPPSVAYDRVNNRLFVADYIYNRVMIFDVSSITNGQNAINELGHAAGGTAFTATASGHTQSTMHFCNAVAFDPKNNRLFVSEESNNRILVFNTSSVTNGMNASNVIGQTNFTNTGAASTQSRLSNPKGMSYDTNTDRLFVSDNNNHRVLVFNAGASVLPTNSASAVNVIGQVNFTNNNKNLSRDGLALDDNDNANSCAYYSPATTYLYVCDTYYHRIMIFDGGTLPSGDYFNP